jgi:gliding motility-associated-like protein
MNINVPTNIPLGTTRMRVRSAYNTVPASPCGNEMYGETEDYNVLVVDNPANPGLTLIPDTICSGQTASLSVLGVTSGTFRWYSQQSGGPLLFVGATYTTPVLTNNTSAPITQNYYVDVIVNGCPSGRLLFPVVINPVESVQILSSESTVCVGEEFTLSTPDNFASYTWTPAAVLESPNAQATDAIITEETTFQLEAVSSNGCVATGTITIPIDVAPPLTIVSSATGVCPGDDVTLTASGSTSGYNWLAADGLAASTDASVTASPGGTTTYTVTANSSTGACPATASIEITVFPAAFADAGPSVAYCLNESETLQGSGNTGAMFSWTPSTGLSNASATSPQVSNTDSQIYTLTVTTANGCEASDQVQVTVNTLPVANPGSNDSYCSGEAIILNGSGGIQYAWSPALGLNNANIANPEASPLVTTNYSLVVTDNNGCTSPSSPPITVTVYPLPTTPLLNSSGQTNFCEGGSTILSTGIASGYIWSSGQNTSQITVSSSGTFTVQTIDANGCVSLSSQPINVVVNALPSAPQISSSGVSSFCDGDDVVLTSVPAAGVTWSNGMSNSPITVANSGQYTATFMDANGCESQPSSPLVLTVIPLAPTPVINADGATTFCFGDSVRLTCSTADTYAWSTGATGNSIVVSSSGTYSVTTTDECPSADMTSELNVFVRPIPEPNIASDTLIDCLPSVLNFSASPTGMGPFNYYWSFGDGSGSTAISPFYEYQNPGTYTIGLTVVDPVGCTGTESIVNKVRILPRAILDYTITPPTVSLSNANVEFSGLAPNSTNASWSISGFNGLDTIPLIGFDTAYAQHTFSDTGLYIVQYTVTTAEGCEASVTDLVRVYEDFDMYVPLSFSPDGDGINDEFFPVLPGFEIEGYEFRIFNRWGRQIFMTYSTDSGWSGDEMPAGYYFWKIEGKSKKNLESIQRDGYLFLVR